MKVDLAPHITLPATTTAFSRDFLHNIFHKYARPEENFTTVVAGQSAAAQLAAMEELYPTFSHKRTLIHIGMGGSTLGPRMLLQTLQGNGRSWSGRGGRGGSNYHMQFCFLDNSDPESTAPAIAQCNLQETLFYVVSKSGTTAETMAILSLVIDKFHANNIPQSRWREYLVFCTDPELGDLRAMANDLGIFTLDIPPGVGGAVQCPHGGGAISRQICKDRSQATARGGRSMPGAAGSGAFSPVSGCHRPLLRHPGGFPNGLDALLRPPAQF